MRGLTVKWLLSIQPSYVKCIDLLTEKAKYFWNLLPTVPINTSAVCVVCGGFDQEVDAAVNLGFHFMQLIPDEYIFYEYLTPSTTHFDNNNNEEFTAGSDTSTQFMVVIHSLNPKFCVCRQQYISLSDF